MRLWTSVVINPEGRGGLGQAIKKMSSADYTKFYVFDRSSTEGTAILLVKAGCRGYSLYDAIGNLKTIVSTLSSGSSWAHIRDGEGG